ncbi:MAG: DinB family protein [Chloroflexota bacterium]
MQLTSDERQWRIEIIRAFPARLDTLVRGLTEEQLSTEYLPGEWTVRQIVHHLPDSHGNSFFRLKFILTEDYPTLKPYNQATWALLPDVALTPVDVSLRLLSALHERWCVLWDNLTDEQWLRKGYHPENGDMTPDDLLVVYSNHCDIHWEQITRTLAAAPAK